MAAVSLQIKPGKLRKVSKRNAGRFLGVILGIAGAIFVVMWLYCVANSPAKHPRITPEERRLLAKYLHTSRPEEKKSLAVPWLKIFTYPPVLAVIFTNTADLWVLFLLLTCLPLYMEEVLQFDVQSNGLYSSLPFLTMCIGLCVSGVLADYISTRKWLSTTAIRKCFQVTGNLGTAVFILLPGYISCDQRELVIMCLCLCTFMEAVGVGPGYPCNPIDIAPRFAGVIYGISSTIATGPALLAPLAVAELTRNQTNAEWRVVFYLSAGLSAMSAVIYGVFSDSTLAPWADDMSQEVTVRQTTEVGLLSDSKPVIKSDSIHGGTSETVT